MAASIVVSWRSLMTGPKSSPSLGPTLSALAAPMSLSRNVSYTLANTLMRLPAAQRCPALEKAESHTHFTASSRSASSQTMRGFLPPSSSETFFSVLPHTSPIHLPTLVEPVKLTTSTFGCSTSGAPHSVPYPCSTLSTPGGSAAWCSILANSQEVAGVSSAPLSTAALPQISAGNNFHATLAIGVLAAMISPATPQGWRTFMAYLSGGPLVVVRPYGLWPSPAKKRAHAR